VLAAFVILLACPVRYWPVQPGFDETWQFALNFAAANGYAIGRDYVYTVGPLAYLILPSHLGGNLEQALLFQAAMWVVWGVIIVDVFFRAGFSVRSLTVFSLCFSFAAPWFWFNFLGPENLMLVGALLLLVVAHTRGGWIRYVAALVLIGVLPLLKLTAGVIGLSALAGFLGERVIERRPTIWREVLAAAVVTMSVACGVGLLLVPSPSALARFARGGAEVMAGYSAAMSSAGNRFEILLAVEALAVLLAILYLHATTNRALARFYVLLLAGPLFFSVKHGFVRQDIHVVNFFCFVALALGLVLLTVRVGRTEGPCSRRGVCVRGDLAAAALQPLRLVGFLVSRREPPRFGCSGEFSPRSSSSGSRFCVGEFSRFVATGAGGRCAHWRLVGRRLVQRLHERIYRGSSDDAVSQSAASSWIHAVPRHVECRVGARERSEIPAVRRKSH
jgi:hypothetical protein